MITEKMQERFDEIERLVRAAGLKPFDVHFFEVPTSMICQTASYGLPTRYSHWSHGKSFQYQKSQGEMGYSKIYELILNSNPSIALLDKSNSDTANLMIAAHCFGHSSVFANNIMFKQYREPSIIETAKHHAHIIDQFKKDYGDDEVDNWIDIALALDRHVDLYKGFIRKKYPKRHVAYEDRKTNEWEDVVYGSKKEPMVKRKIEGLVLPPVPEKDILWFLSEYANLEEWQKRVFDIVRRESYYFFPQYTTKILNEGMASLTHTEIMRQYALGNDNTLGVKDIKYPLTSEEHLDFVRLHEKVVQPGAKIHLKIKQEIGVDCNGKPIYKEGWNPILSKHPHLFNAAIRLNPYYVGFTILMDIRERWDKYCKEGYRENEWGDKIPVTTNGWQKVLEVADSEDDVSLFRNYLTEELCDKLHLFAYGNPKEYDDTYEIQESIEKRIKNNGHDHLGKSSIDKQWISNRTVQVLTKELRDVINIFARDNSNYGVPQIVIRRVSCDGTLRLEHLADDLTNIDMKYAEPVIKYIHKVWNRPVELIRKVPYKDVTWIIRYDGTSFSREYETIDYIELLESMEGASVL